MLVAVPISAGGDRGLTKQLDYAQNTLKSVLSCTFNMSATMIVPRMSVNYLLIQLKKKF